MGQNRETSKSARRIISRDIVVPVGVAAAFLVQITLCLVRLNSLDQFWLLFVGFVLVWAAMILGWQARSAFETSGEALQGESRLKSTRLVETGVYSVVRHPMYLSFMVLAIALACISQHWLSAAMAVLAVGALYVGMMDEERHSLQKFGDAYLEYGQRVPRINVPLGLLRAWRRRQKGDGE